MFKPIGTFPFHPPVVSCIFHSLLSLSVSLTISSTSHIIYVALTLPFTFFFHKYSIWSISKQMDRATWRLSYMGPFQLLPSFAHPNALCDIRILLANAWCLYGAWVLFLISTLSCFAYSYCHHILLLSYLQAVMARVLLVWCFTQGYCD